MIKINIITDLKTFDKMKNSTWLNTLKNEFREAENEIITTNKIIKT